MKKMMKKRMAIALTCTFATVAVDAASVADEIKAAKAEIEANLVVRGVRRGQCRYYSAWFIENCTVAEREAILERNIAAHRKWIKLDPSSAAAHADLGCVYATVSRWKEAKPELEAAIAAGDKLDPKRRSQVRWEMANCLWAEGDKEGAKKFIAEVAAMCDVGKVSGFMSPPGQAQYLTRAFEDQDADADYFNLPHSVDCKPFPTPQEATYGEKKVSLAKVEIRAKLGTNGTAGTDGTSPASRISPVGPDDPIARLLKKKLTRFGSIFAPGGTPIEIELSPDAPVDKPQGYSIDVADGKVIVKARTRLGLTWGVVSLIQCVDREKLAVAECTIRDWPTLERRGIVVYWQPGFLELSLFNKMSSVSFNMGTEWSLGPLDIECYRRFAENMRGFGIETYYLIRQITMEPMLPLSSPRTWEFHLERARLYASLGVGNSFHLDDSRFPMHPDDIKNAGTGANLDAKYLTRLYREVKSEYPDHFMQFCPPFYWGPDGGVNYPEGRDEYLKSLARDLDPEIDVHWTGPRVKSHYMTDEKTKWYADLIGRKPTIFHNGNAAGQHAYMQYGVDPTCYKKSHSPRLFDNIASFQQNMSHYAEGGEIGSCMDWCWNPAAHDGRESIRRAVDQLEGPGVADIIEKATPSLSYFDKYLYYKPRPELLNEDQAKLDKIVADAEAAWKDVLAVAKNKGRFVNGFSSVTDWARRKAATRRNPPEWLKAQYDAAKSNAEYAKKEVGFDESKGDQFIPATLLHGGKYWGLIEDSTGDKPRDVKFIETRMELSGQFDCILFPPENPVRFIVTGMRYLDRWEKPPKVAAPQMELEVNGRVVWRGEMYKDDVYKPFEIVIPTDAMQRSNTFKLRNSGPYVKDEGRPVVHYVVIKM